MLINIITMKQPGQEVPAGLGKVSHWVSYGKGTMSKRLRVTSCSFI